MDLSAPVIVAARRTPIAAAGGRLSTLDAVGLAAPVLAALAGDLKPVTAVRPASEPVADEVVLGNCRGPGGDVARISALAAGLGPAVPGISLDRQCGSGLEAIRLAAALVGAGHAEVVLAGGTESASHAPGGRTHRAAFTPAGWPDPEMGPAADEAARRLGITRDRQDRYAARSHLRALRAGTAGGFDAEMVPAAGLAHDPRPRAGLTVQRLARFRPAFAPDGTVTVGNACGIDDGAGAVAVISERLRRAAGLPGLRVLATAAVGTDPSCPPLAAAPAVRAVLARAGRRLPELDQLEITEAFAAQLLACTDDLGLDPFGADAERVCPDGGAIALGHPWSASGTFLVLRLFARLVTAPGGAAGDGPAGGGGGRLGLAACAIGGGQGLAMLLERVG